MFEGWDWAQVWRFLAPILKEGLIALLMALLALLGYDKYVPSRYARRSGEVGTPEAAIWSQSLRERGRDAGAQQPKGGSKA